MKKLRSVSCSDDINNILIGMEKISHFWYKVIGVSENDVSIIYIKTATHSKMYPENKVFTYSKELFKNDYIILSKKDVYL